MHTAGAGRGGEGPASLRLPGRGTGSCGLRRWGASRQRGSERPEGPLRPGCEGGHARGGEGGACGPEEAEGGLRAVPGLAAGVHT